MRKVWVESKALLLLLVMRPFSRRGKSGSRPKTALPWEFRGGMLCHHSDRFVQPTGQSESYQIREGITSINARGRTGGGVGRGVTLYSSLDTREYTQDVRRLEACAAGFPRLIKQDAINDTNDFWIQINDARN